MLRITPDLKTFKTLSKRYNLIPVRADVLADLDTPVSCFLKTASDRYSFLLESVEGGERLGRYSFIGVDASTVFESKGHEIRVKGLLGNRVYQTAKNPLEELQSLMRSVRQAPMEGLPPFSGGSVGYLSYDTVRFFEKIPDKNRDETALPDSLFIFSDILLAFDHIQRKISILCNASVTETRQAEQAYRQAVKKIHTLAAMLAKPAPPVRLLSLDAKTSPMKVSSNFSLDSFSSAVKKAKEYIRRGDIFQVVLSQAFETSVKAEPLDIYRALRSVNPSPYMFFLNCGGFQLVGSSPEVHVRCEEGRAELRPIAGTRPRGKNEKEDLAMEKELLSDQKERAEHLMLVDLGRNDLGRVCEYNSVQVPEFMTIERYSHVMHIVSLVKGKLGKGRSIFDLLRETFPAGTVSGAPKVRAMEIIDELENRKRSVYSGVVGYFSYSGNLDSCIAIRTILVKDGKATVQAGAGVVADSKPAMEYQETVNKARALMRAIEIAEAGK